MARFSKKKEEKYEFRIEDFQQADERALRYLVIGHWKELVSFARSYLANQQEAEDTVQEIFSTVWQKRFDFTDYISLRRFLFIAIKNRALDKIDTQKRRSSYFKEYYSQTKDISTQDNHLQIEIAELALASSLQKMVSLANDLLPPKTKEVFMLAMGGLKDREIAEKMAIARQNVSKYRQRGLLILRKHFISEDVLSWSVLLVIIHVLL